MAMTLDRLPDSVLLQVLSYLPLDVLWRLVRPLDRRFHLLALKVLTTKCVRATLWMRHSDLFYCHFLSHQKKDVLKVVRSTPDDLQTLLKMFCGILQLEFSDFSDDFLSHLQLGHEDLSHLQRLSFSILSSSKFQEYNFLINTFTQPSITSLRLEVCELDHFPAVVQRLSHQLQCLELSLWKYDRSVLLAVSQCSKLQHLQLCWTRVDLHTLALSSDHWNLLQSLGNLRSLLLSGFNYTQNMFEGFSARWPHLMSVSFVHCDNITTQSMDEVESEFEASLLEIIIRTWDSDQPVIKYTRTVERDRSILSFLGCRHCALRLNGHWGRGEPC